MTPMVSLDRANVLLMIDDLCLGGAERQLVELARGLDKQRFRVLVATLYPGQPLERHRGLHRGDGAIVGIPGR